MNTDEALAKLKDTVRERLGYGNEYSDEEVESVIAE